MSSFDKPFDKLRKFSGQVSRRNDEKSLRCTLAK
jgi:hypothetical protein